MSDKKLKKKLLKKFIGKREIINKVLEDEKIKNEYYLNYSQNNILSIIAIAISALSMIWNVVVSASSTDLVLSNIISALVFIIIPYLFLLFAIVHDGICIGDRKKAFYFLKCQEVIEKSIKK